MHRSDPLLLTILASLASCSGSPEPYDDEGCVIVPDETSECQLPGSVDIGQLYLPGQCGNDLEIIRARDPVTKKQITSQGGTTTWNCCYVVEVVDHDPNGQCVVGRPYPEARRNLRARLRAEGAPRHAGGERAAAWANAALGEHASIAAFNRLQLQLMRHGAPTDLLRDVQQAALDEIRHTDACFALAQHFGGTQGAPGPFPFGEPIDPDVSLATLAYAAAREGCLAETVGAHAARVAAELSDDEVVRRELGSIARDEAQHAALSYRLVAWALNAGGPDVRQAVARALSEPCPNVDCEELELRAGLEPGALAHVVSEAQREVLAPAIAMLMTGPRPGTAAAIRPARPAI